MLKMAWLYFKKHVIQLVSVLKGMSVTIRYLLFRTPITKPYPMDENRAGQLPARFRGQLALISERRAAEGAADCISCKMCEKVCPNRSIVIEMGKDKKSDGKTYAEIYDWNYSTCIFCNLCVEACNFDALTFVTTFEGAQQSRENLLWDKKRLIQAYNDSKEYGHKRSYDEFWEQKRKREAAAKKAAEEAAKAKAAEEQKNPAPTPPAEGAA